MLFELKSTNYRIFVQPHITKNLINKIEDYLFQVPLIRIINSQTI